MYTWNVAHVKARKLGGQKCSIELALTKERRSGVGPKTPQSLGNETDHCAIIMAQFLGQLASCFLMCHSRPIFLKFRLFYAIDWQERLI